MFPQYTTADCERFWSHVHKTEGCWLWTASTGGGGYGQVIMGGRMWRAHRWSYTTLVGEIPAGLCVLHACDSAYAVQDHTYRRCVNPAHLWLGTHQDNIADREAKGRTARGERSGPYTRPERIARGDRNGSRRHPERRPRGATHDAHLHPESRQGERNGRARLTQEQIADIRSRHARGEHRGALAHIFGVSSSTIGDIVGGRTWAQAHTLLYPERHSRGQNHYAAKLTEQDVRDIRRRYAAGGITQRALAAEYGVHFALISQIVLRQKWTHVE